MNLSKLRYLVLLLGITLLFLGSIGWVSPFFKIKIFSNEFPLGNCLGIVVDNQDRIYVGEGFYSRIQVYDSKGGFLRGWPVDAAGGVFRMRLNNENNLEVATVRTNRMVAFDINGKLLASKENAGENLYQKWRTSNECRYRSESGNVIEYQNVFTHPRIVKVTPQGQQTTIHSTPFHQWLFMGPMPAWVFQMAGIGLLSLNNRMGKNRKTTRS